MHIDLSKLLLLFIHMLVSFHPTPCSTTSSYLHLCTRDGPDQSSPQIGQFSGSSVQEGVSTTANQVLIKFHSDFSTSGFFELHYYGNTYCLWCRSLLVHQHNESKSYCEHHQIRGKKNLYFVPVYKVVIPFGPLILLMILFPCDCIIINDEWLLMLAFWLN